MWLRGINQDAATMRATARSEFREKTEYITRRWKDGFKALKEENDSLQKEASAWLKAELADIETLTRQHIAQGPPE
jgi:hypothetical protein